MSSSGDKPRAPATRLVQGGRRKEWTGAVVNPPVWRASTHLYDDSADLARGRANETCLTDGAPATSHGQVATRLPTCVRSIKKRSVSGKHFAVWVARPQGSAKNPPG